MALKSLTNKVATACPPGKEAMLIANSETESESTITDMSITIVKRVSFTIPILSFRFTKEAYP